MPHQIRRRSGKLGTTQLLDLRCGRTSLGRQWIPVTRSWIHHSFPLRLVKLDVDMSPGLRGLQKYKISIPPVIRARYIDDQVYGEEWKALLKDFDTKHFVYILHQIICDN